MQEIIKEYGSVIISVVAIFALAAMIKTLLADDGTVMEVFGEVMAKFFTMAGDFAGIASDSASNVTP